MGKRVLGAVGGSVERRGMLIAACLAGNREQGAGVGSR